MRPFAKAAMVPAIPMSSKDRRKRVVAKPRIFSGIQPTGGFHIGNWLGAVRNWVALGNAAKESGKDAFFCVVDAHAITVPYEPKDLRTRIDELALDLVACGIDPREHTLFVQSDVPEHMELAWYLAAATPMGDLGRMTQFKDKSDGKDFVSTALFTYPVLMSADILLYKATEVPVGDDQLQHLELARETSRRFNHRFGGVFPEPQPLLTKATRIMGLDGDGKMSKSKGNTIPLFDEPKAFWKKLQGAFTDPNRKGREDPGNPEICNIYTMHKELSTAEEQENVVKNCTTAGWGCYDCKMLLHANFEKEVAPLREKRKSLNVIEIREALHENSKKARQIAQETIGEVRASMGLGCGLPR